MYDGHKTPFLHGTRKEDRLNCCATDGFRNRNVDADEARGKPLPAVAPIAKNGEPGDARRRNRARFQQHPWRYYWIYVIDQETDGAVASVGPIHRGNRE